MAAEKRWAFDEVADLYDRARPGYPAELFADLVALAALAPGARVLEIGCGTGQATVPMAERGFRITAVEMGPNLAAIARRNLAAFPAVEVHDADFESWRLPDEPFDLVMAATAFHWIDEGLRHRKAAAALRPGGVLAVFASLHVAGGTQDFFEEVQECYRRFDPETPPDSTGPQPAEDIADDPIGGEGFEPKVHRRFVWERAYTTETYLDVLRTYSGHRILAPHALEELLRCIGEVLEARYGGRITKRYLTQLAVACRSG